MSARLVSNSSALEQHAQPFCNSKIPAAAAAVVRLLPLLLLLLVPPPPLPLLLLPPLTGGDDRRSFRSMFMAATSLTMTAMRRF